MKLVHCKSCFTEVWSLKNALPSCRGLLFVLYNYNQNEYFLRWTSPNIFSDKNINTHIFIQFSLFAVQWVSITSSIWVILKLTITKFKIHLYETNWCSKCWATSCPLPTWNSSDNHLLPLLCASCLWYRR